MKTLLAFAALAGALLLDSIFTCKFLVPDRVKRFSMGLNRLLLVVPLLAVPVFAVLFLFGLKDRLCERLSHALFLLSLWLYAARYYWFLISYCKYLEFNILFFLNRFNSFYQFILLGFVSAASAVCLTPLDHYVKMIYSVLGPASIFAGAGLLLVFCIAAFFTTCVNKTEVSGGAWGIDR